MFQKYIRILSNPLLYYSTKDGKSVFRNFSFVKETGCMYDATFEKSNVGKTLEYRFHLDNCLNLTYFLTALVLYLIFIHLKFSILGLLFFELLWVLIVTAVRLHFSYQYHNFLIAKYGQYEVVDFEPPITKRKSDEYLAQFRSNIIVGIIVIALLLIPSFLLNIGMKFSLTPKHNGYKRAIVFSNIYNFVYPKDAQIYDMRAIAHYMKRDYDESLKDYKKALDLSGKNFTKRDVARFENLLYLQKRVTSSQDAVDVFNEYVTKKNMSVLEQSQMLWIKSIFKIENSIIEGILQDYNDLLASLDSKDVKNNFYISCDKAYMLYLMQMYEQALNSYDILIKYAQDNETVFSKELQSLYVERGWTKKRLGDNMGANIDFGASQIPADQLRSYEPAYQNQQFVIEK